VKAQMTGQPEGLLQALADLQRVTVGNRIDYEYPWHRHLQSSRQLLPQGDHPVTPLPAIHLSRDAKRAVILSLLACIAYALLCGMGLIVLARDPAFGMGEALAVLLILGLGLSVAAWLATLGATPRPQPVREPGREFLWVTVILVAIGIGFLGYGLSALHAAVSHDPAQSIAVIVAKILATVLVPALAFRWLGYTWRELLAFTRLNRVELRALLIMMTVLALLQFTMGRGPEEVRALMSERGFAMWQVLLLAVPAWLWLCVEAGIVEEFLFRVLLQSRLAAWSRSSVVGVVGMAVLFGLAHAPGYVLRGAYAKEGMAHAPDALSAAAYALVVVSPVGLVFGLIWARTRSLTLVVLLHGWADLIPNLASLVRAFTA
jgi:membrane protease YdiL (CAAX protease family)